MNPTAPVTADDCFIYTSSPPVHPIFTPPSILPLITPPLRSLHSDSSPLPPFSSSSSSSCSLYLSPPFSLHSFAVRGTDRHRRQVNSTVLLLCMHCFSAYCLIPRSCMLAGKWLNVLWIVLHFAPFYGIFLRYSFIHMDNSLLHPVFYLWLACFTTLIFKHKPLQICVDVKRCCAAI